MSGGYTHQDAQLRRNAFVRLAQIPRHQLALWNRYELNRNVGAGLGLVYQSSSLAAIRTATNTTRLPGFTRVDAALFLKAGDRLELQLNVENLAYGAREVLKSWNNPERRGFFRTWIPHQLPSQTKALQPPELLVADPSLSDPEKLALLEEWNLERKVREDVREQQQISGDRFETVRN
jgi:hypothetical protein